MQNIVELLYLWLAFVREVYLCYDRIFNGFIGILPDRPMIIPVEVRSALELVYFKLVLPHLYSLGGQGYMESPSRISIVPLQQGRVVSLYVN